MAKPGRKPWVGPRTVVPALRLGRRWKWRNGLSYCGGSDCLGVHRCRECGKVYKRQWRALRRSVPKGLPGSVLANLEKVFGD